MGELDEDPEMHKLKKCGFVDNRNTKKKPLEAAFSVTRLKLTLHSRC